MLFDHTLCWSTLRYVDRPYIMLIDHARLCDQSSYIKNIPHHSAAVSFVNVTIWWTVTVTIKYIVVTTTYHIGTVGQYILHMRYNQSKNDVLHFLMTNRWPQALFTTTYLSPICHLFFIKNVFGNDRPQCMVYFIVYRPYVCRLTLL